MDHINKKHELERLYRERSTRFLTGTGLPYAELKAKAFSLSEELLAGGEERVLVRARVFAFLLDNAEIGFAPEQPFADLINCEGIMSELRSRWQARVEDTELSELIRNNSDASAKWFFRVNPDYGHLCPDWDAIIGLGPAGILARLSGRGGKLFEAGELIYSAIIRVILRLAEVAKAENSEVEEDLRAIAAHAPATLAQALQLLTIMFRLFEYVDGERTRSLGGIDRLLLPFWQSEKDSPDFRNKIALFLLQAWSMRVPYDLPMFLGGRYKPGTEEAYEVAKLIVSVYSELDIYSPKIHVRVTKENDNELIKLVCDSIRKNNSSFVFISDETAAASLESAGISPEDAAEYVPIGCYEPAAYRKEIACTGAASINLAKAVELALFDGNDPASGKQIGIHTGDARKFSGFEEFYGAVKKQLAFAIEKTAAILRAYERHYGEVYPIPMLSVTFESCLESGIDALEGGAKYNNSSINFIGIGTAADSLCAVKSIYESGFMTIERLTGALRANFRGYEVERKYLLGLPKYGNNTGEPERLGEMLTRAVSELADLPNARGGRFKPGLFSIDNVFPAGRATGATPDGRLAGEPLSKNLSPTAGADKNGITAVLLSCTQLCHERFPNGSVLDVMVHPSAVSGDEGLDVFASLIRTYFELGGFAVHGNVISADTLLAAQAEPKKYANLQVRLCGWNVYFTNLTKAEQDELIRAAKQ